jgi:hypothetical protein
MTDIVLDATVTAQLREQKGPVNLIGADGTYLGEFKPTQAFGRMTEEEIAEAIAEPDDGPWYTLDQIKAEWRRKRP